METQCSDHSARFSPADRVPSPKKSTDRDRLLRVVLLTDLDGPSKAKLIQHVQESLEDKIQIQTWAPSPLLLQSVAKQGVYRDSQANLYALAIQAYRSGRSSFIAADELTKRQLTGTCRVGEDPTISVVMVSARPKSSATTAAGKDEVRVVARRTSGEQDENAQLLEMLDHLEPDEIDLYDEDIDIHVYSQNGLVLHEPDRRVFTVDTAASLGREQFWDAVTTALSTGRRPLPMELVTDIISHVDDMSPEPVKFPAWKRRQKELRLVILLFSRATTEEHRKTLSTIQHAAQKHLGASGEDQDGMTVELIPWERHRIVSRRELMTFWYEYLRHDPPPGTRRPPLNFLLEPIQDMDSAQFGKVYRDGGRLTLISPTTLDQMIRDRRPWEPEVEWYLDTMLAPDSEETEYVYDPDQPFYFNPPPWRPAGDGDGSYNWVGVFYLTDQLTKEQDLAIRTELTTKYETEPEVDEVDRKECCYVPWKSGKDGQVDGTLDDVWEILCKIYRDVSIGGTCGCFVCIDQQSGIDRTVLFVKPDWYRHHDMAERHGLLKDMPAPRLRGFLYGRFPGREAHLLRLDLSAGRRSIEGFDHVKKFRRPGWPAPGVLPRESED